MKGTQGGHGFTNRAGTCLAMTLQHWLNSGGNKNTQQEEAGLAAAEYPWSREIWHNSTEEITMKCIIQLSLNHRMAWVQGTSKSTQFQPSCHWQGCYPPEPAAQSPIQPGLECLQGWGILLQANYCFNFFDKLVLALTWWHFFSQPWEANTFMNHTPSHTLTFRWVWQRTGVCMQGEHWPICTVLISMQCDSFPHSCFLIITQVDYFQKSYPVTLQMFTSNLQIPSLLSFKQIIFFSNLGPTFIRAYIGTFQNYSN